VADRHVLLLSAAFKEVADSSDYRFKSANLYLVSTITQLANSYFSSHNTWKPIKL